MIWCIVHQGCVVARGSYAQMLDTAEEWRVLDRAYHRDGTELAPHWLERGYSIVPQITAPARRAAA